MTDITQRARELADSLASTVTTISMGDSFEMDMEAAERMILAALFDVVNEAPDPPDNGSGFLEVGIVDGQIVINLPKPMSGHINFAPEQAYILGRVLLEKADATDPRDAEIERRTVEMPLSDANNLDAVVHALWIEGSDTTPAEAVAELHSEIERLRESAAELSAIKRALDIEDDNGSPVSDVENLLAENERLREIVKTMDAVMAYHEKWEASLIMENSAWKQELPTFTQDLWNGFMTVQEKRNAAREAARQTLGRDPTDK